MDELFKKKNMGQVVLAVLFILYLVMGYKTPDTIANMVDTYIGKILIISVVLLLFIGCNPILGVLGIFVAYHLITQSSVATGSYGLENYMPTEKKKYAAMSQYNQFPYTLEQEIVKKMAPINKSDYSATNTFTFNPVLDDLHDAAPIGYKGVV